MSRHRELKKVGDLFEKYKTILTPPQRSIEKAFVTAVKEATGLDLPPEKVSYTVGTKTISLQVPSVLKQEVLLNKEAIYQALQQQLGAKGQEIVII